MSLFARLTRHAPHTALHNPVLDSSLPPLADEQAQLRYDGCGWHESSLELQHGLQVCEFESDQPGLGAVQGLPLRWWLELTLGAQARSATVNSELSRSASQAMNS